MATESPLIHDGGNLLLSTAADFRNSTNTGSTLAGPNGSGQFLAVVLSTTVDRTVQLPSTATAQFKPIGICQNKPRPGEVVDVGVLGVSKAVAGLAVVRGSDLALSSTLAGTLVPFSTAVGAQPCARAYESAAAGQVFTCFVYGVGAPGGV